MNERISFTLKFVFESKDNAKALKLHRMLKQYGAVGNIVHPIYSSDAANRLKRMDSIINIMKIGRVYTTGQLWRQYDSMTGYKTFQRDLNTLVIQGRINGFRQTGKKGNTIYWSIPIIESGGEINDKERAVAKNNNRQNDFLVAES